MVRPVKGACCPDGPSAKTEVGSEVQADKTGHLKRACPNGRHTESQNLALKNTLSEWARKFIGALRAGPNVSARNAMV